MLTPIKKICSQVNQCNFWRENLSNYLKRTAQQLHGMFVVITQKVLHLFQNGLHIFEWCMDGTMIKEANF